MRCLARDEADKVLSELHAGKLVGISVETLLPTKY
jgi:hypothetical protein